MTNTWAVHRRPTAVRAWRRYDLHRRYGHLLGSTASHSVCGRCLPAAPPAAAVQQARHRCYDCHTAPSTQYPFGDAGGGVPALTAAVRVASHLPAPRTTHHYGVASTYMPRHHGTFTGFTACHLTAALCLLCGDAYPVYIRLLTTGSIAWTVAYRLPATFRDEQTGALPRVTALATLFSRHMSPAFCCSPCLSACALMILSGLVYPLLSSHSSIPPPVKEGRSSSRRARHALTMPGSLLCTHTCLSAPLSSPFTP